MAQIRSRLLKNTRKTECGARQFLISLAARAAPFALQWMVLSIGATGLVWAFQGDQIQLSGAANFRDIGGYRTSEGQRIKRDVIFRSGELSGLTTSDQQLLEPLQIRYEIDLRTDKERAESPTRWGGNPPTVISISVGEPRNSNPAQSLAGGVADLKDHAQAQQFMQQTTARIATQGAPEIGEVIRRLAQGDEPALIHCSAGKDRTGVTVAVLMTLLGVPRDQVYLEYTKSNDATDKQIERMKIREASGATSGLESVPPEVMKTMLGAKRSYIEAAFKAIDAQYGSFDTYAKNGLKITPDQIQDLRENLLEPISKRANK
jgi:protein-tyrosine phosphatase